MGNITLGEVTPRRGKGALGLGGHHRESTRITEEELPGDVELRVNQLHKGGCELALKPRCDWEGSLGKTKIANRTREIRPSGMKRGAWEEGDVRSETT